MATGKPIGPSEINAAKRGTIPGEVFDAFNELIAENFRGGMATIRQEDVVARILAKLPTLSRGDVFAKGYLDIETVYVHAGWTSVTYDKPGFCESYPATFKFVARA